MDKSSQAPRYKIVLAGCGKMGSSMLESWLGAGLLGTVLVIDPGGLPEKFEKDPRVTHVTAAPQRFSEKPDIVVLAIKPQAMKEALRALPDAQGGVILSIAAGQSLSTLAGLLAPGQPIVRVMPNTPAAIGKGMSVAVAGPGVSEAQKEIAGTLLAATGQVRWITDESLMDAVTALSGSGPAYVFYLIEVLARAGEKLGLAPDMAMVLARQTVVGSAALAESEKDTPAATLRENVTSPGGTTAAALEVLMNGALQDIFDRALEKAEERGRELNG